MRGLPSICLICLCLLGGLEVPTHAQSAGAVGWGKRETRLATEYLRLLLEDPQDKRLLGLLWELYQRHDSTELLLRSVTQQARTQQSAALELLLAQLQQRAGLSDAALQSLQRALALAKAPMRQRVLAALAELSQERGNLAAAVQFLQRAMAEAGLEDSQRREISLRLGGLQWRLGQRESAVAAWRDAAGLSEADPSLLWELVREALRLGAIEPVSQWLQRLGSIGTSAQRLEALGQLAKLRQLHGNFTEADEALRQALAMLDFRDALYEEFWRRRVRLHEHAGWLPKMEQELRGALGGDGLRPWLDWVRYCRAVADLEGEMKGLQGLLQRAPQWDEYRWQWVRLLLDHDGAAQAASLLDQRLKGDVSDPVALVLLRCEAEVRLGNSKAAVQRLRSVLALNRDEAVVRQVLDFARERSLDPIVREVLQSRVTLRPDDAKALFELVVFLRSRNEEPEAQRILDAYVQQSPNDHSRGRRLAEVAGFLASGRQNQQALDMAKAAASRPDAGTEDFLRLADLLSDAASGRAEALQWLERAWQVSTNAEQALDVDERLIALLSGSRAVGAVVRGTAGDFQLPEIFTGKGFASEDQGVPETSQAPAVLEKARQLCAGLAEGKVEVRQALRAAWWAMRAGLIAQAYEAFHLLDAAALAAVQVQRQLLELALEDGNVPLAMRLLRKLMQVDAAQRAQYAMRLAELALRDEQNAQAALNLGLSHERTGWRWVSVPPPVGASAVAILQRALREAPHSEALLNALTQCLLLQGRLEQAWPIWRQAIDSAGDTVAVGLLERMSQWRLERGDWKAFVVAQMELLQRQEDVQRQREWFKRFMDRLLWAGESNREMEQEQANVRLDEVAAAMQRLSNAKPLDGFAQEALAQVWLRRGDAVRAFAAMQRAYYLAPDTPFSLEQLRDLALRSNQIEAAVAFQRQVAASAPRARLAAESRRLVEMLESSLQMAQADKVRRHLESRFAQDPAALEELAAHYESTGQDEAQRRVYEQIARVRPWDARSALRLALKCLRLADEQAAMVHLSELLSRSSGQPVQQAGEAFEQLPLPWVDQRGEPPISPLAGMISALDSAPGLRSADTASLRRFMALPRPWLAALPQSNAALRLRAIEELGRLMRRRNQIESWSDQWARWPSALERCWAAFSAGQWEQARELLGQLWQASPASAGRLEGCFVWQWMLQRAQAMGEAMQWARQGGLAGDAMELRQRCLLAVVGMRAEMSEQRFAPGELEPVGRVGSATVLGILRRLQESQRYEEALELGESLRRHQAALGGAFVFSLARIAESAERWDLARGYLSAVLNSAVRPEAYRGTYDPYLFSLGAANRLAVGASGRERDWRHSWSRLQAADDSSMTRLRLAAVAGFAGARELAATRLTELWSNDFLWARSLGEITGELVPQGSTRGDEAMHQRSYWEEVREMQARMIQEGLGPVVQQANERMIERFGGVAHNPKTGMEFGQWRASQLLRRLRGVDHPTRLRLLREYLGPVDMQSELAVEALGDLGAKLEAASMSREAVAVYQRLPSRAPANPEYALSLIRAAETAMDTKVGLSFTLQLLQAEPPYKPPQPGDEVLREKHARFLAWDLDVGGLHQRAWVDQPTRVLRGRVPHEVPYLRELALLYERCGLKPQAVQSWQRLVQAHVTNADHGLAMDWDACLRLASLQMELGQESQALVVLQPIALKPALGAVAQQALRLRAVIYEKQRRWEDLQRLLPLALSFESVDVMVEVSRLVASCGHRAEAMDFLVRAQRSAKDDLARFELRLAQMQLAASDSSWSVGSAAVHLASLLRLEPRQPLALGRWLEWMALEANGPRRDGWLKALGRELQGGADPMMASVLLCACFEGQVPEPFRQGMRAVWQRAVDRDRPCLDLGVERLLAQGDSALASEAVAVIDALPGAKLETRKSPLMLRVAHARGDRARVQDLFSQVVRMPPSSGSQTEAWALALEQCGEPRLASELLQRAVQQMEHTQTLQPELILAWCRFLMRTGRHEEAETTLLRWHWGLQAEAAKVIFELYRSWGKLPQLSVELAKFHLAGGLQREIELQAAMNLGLALPLRGMDGAAGRGHRP